MSDLSRVYGALLSAQTILNTMEPSNGLAQEQMFYELQNHVDVALRHVKFLSDTRPRDLRRAPLIGGA
jgi:hypothetical protein